MAQINYGAMMYRAMRGVLAEVLGQVAEHGLPGDHHFYITFETKHPGCDIPDWLVARYPDSMTIVLQEWFADLAVSSDRFAVTLNFQNAPHRLVVPFSAVQTFVDPSVEFGLKFDAQEERPDGPDDDPDQAPVPEPDQAPAEQHAAEIVSLDRFRKT